ncbi:MAG: tetratricopeptide repeat protein [Oscillospiraceae bacterium]|nr:tetratricopeptide repeat protein [Oscillospiraceae bacterium]
MTIGEIIRNRREELSASRKDICQGICTESMLYKVEGGTKSFKPETLALILERLGMHNVFDGELITTNDYRYVQTIRQVNVLRISGDTDKAAELLSTIEEYYEEFSVSTKQRFDMCETLLTEKTVGMSREQKLDSFEQIIRYTIKDFSPMKLPLYFTHVERLVINVIANCYYFIGDFETAIHIHSHIKKCLEDVMLDKTAAARSLLLTCNNLAEVLVACGEYKEALKTAREGLEWAKYMNVINETASSCMYNVAVCLLKIGNKEDYEEAKQMAYDAYNTSRVFNVRSEFTKLYKEFLNENFN